MCLVDVWIRCEMKHGENYEVKEDFLEACLNKDPSEEEIHKIALENVDKIRSFNMKVDVHEFHEAHRMMIEFQDKENLHLYKQGQ